MLTSAVSAIRSSAALEVDPEDTTVDEPLILQTRRDSASTAVLAALSGLCWPLSEGRQQQKTALPPQLCRWPQCSGLHSAPFRQRVYKYGSTSSGRMDLVQLAVSFHILLCAAWARHSYMDSILSARSGGNWTSGVKGEPLLPSCMSRSLAHLSLVHLACPWNNGIWISLSRVPSMHPQSL
ncbi:hypothetical protein EYF80_001733 [Liparis tanakae]|uniref:Uncharacterized protein n=1 Tax=Liparis tanakae TaxID=230148 RepID=A0A4Z2JFV7_9TELE|nr:hypothetical protein EYF80_001733 [Liparis tanakae]